MCSLCLFFLIIRRPPRSTRTDTLLPYTTLFRSAFAAIVDRLLFAQPVKIQADRVLLKKTRPCDINFVARQRSEEHTSELQSIMRSSYAVFCLQKQNQRDNSTLMST